MPVSPASNHIFYPGVTRDPSPAGLGLVFGKIQDEALFNLFNLHGCNASNAGSSVGTNQNQVGHYWILAIVEKFLDFLETAKSDAAFEAEIPAFAERIKDVFGTDDLGAYLVPSIHARRDEMLVERAREWLLDA